MRVLVAVLSVVVVTACATPDRLATGERAQYIPTDNQDDAYRYGGLGVSPLRVRRGAPEELTGTLVDEGAPAPAGTPYYVTIGFASGRPSPVAGIDSAGDRHPPLEVVATGALRPCPVDTEIYARCQIFVMPPGTELVGLALDGVSY